MAFFSIIIPTFNSASVISQCLTSICEQTFSNYEIIIQDGCSTDGIDTVVEDICAKYSRNIIFVQEPDNGIYDAMNKAMKKAAGQWLLFLGSDDKLFDTNVLRDAHSFIISVEADLVYGNVQLTGNALWAKDDVIYDGAFSIGKLLKKNICHQSIFYSRQIINKVGNYNTDYRICADWDYNLHCFAVGKAVFFDRIVSLFKGGGESTNVMENNFTYQVRLYKAKEHFRYSFLNKHFKVYYSFFYNEAYNFYVKKRYFKAIAFYFYYLYHRLGKAKKLLRINV
jgi:glycosyltransferase involved in cell wall biosynthesis